MALLGSSIASEVGLRLLLCPLNSKIVMRTAWQVLMLTLFLYPSEACWFIFKFEGDCSVGIVLPIYSTVKAIETKDQQEQQKWLIYWAAYGTFSMIEVFSDKLFSWFPSYHYLKLAFLIWLQLPDVHGARMLYKNHLQPFFTRHQARVDQIMGLTYVEMVKFISSHQAEIQYARSMLMKITAPLRKASRNTVNPAQPDVPAVIDGQTRVLANAAYVHDD